ncbi:thiamine pyrophosphate-dependent enzyme, partial [Oryzihumus sp.]
AVPSNASRGAANNLPAERVENDVEAIYAAADRAVARARAGKGPTLLEVHTVRLWGHFEGDAQGYRPELADVPSMDPIPRYEQRLRDEGVLDDAVIARTRQEAQARVEQAIAFAKDSPVPDPATASSYVFS